MMEGQKKWEPESLGWKCEEKLEIMDAKTLVETWKTWGDGKWETKIEMRISAKHITCVCVWWRWRIYVYKASRRAGVGEQYPAGSWLPFLHSYNIGRQGRIKLSRACSLCCKVAAFLHCYMCSSWKRYFPRACSEALHGWAVTGVTFLLPGGDSLDSAALLVWGLWCFLKGALCLIALHTLHHGCFASFVTERWLTGTSLYWLSSVKIYSESKSFYVEPFLQLWIVILFF